MDEKGPCIVTVNEEGGRVILVVYSGKAAAEWGKEVEGARKGGFEMLNVVL